MREGKSAVIAEYELKEEALKKCKVLQFESYSEEWLDFILACRNGKDTSDFEIIAGGIANDKVFNTVELYFDGLIDKIEVIKRLKYEKPDYQICLRTQEIIDDFLIYKRSIVL